MKTNRRNVRYGPPPTVEPAAGAVPALEHSSLATINEPSSIAPQPALTSGESASLSTAVVRTAAGLVSANGLSWLSTLIGVLVVPRFLGSSDYGLFAAAIVLTEVLATVAIFGTDNYIVKTAARARELTSEIVVHAMALRLAIWVAVFTPFLAIVTLVVSDGRVPLLFLAVAISGGLGLVHRAHLAGLQANLALAKVAIASAVLGIVAQASTIGILLSGGGLLHLVYAGIFFAACSVTISGTIFWRRFSWPARVRRQEATHLLRVGRPFIAWDLAQLLFARVDLLMLAVFATSAVVGNYAFAHRMLSIPGVLFTVIVGAVYPALVALAPVDKARFSTTLTNAARLGLLGSLPVSAGLALVAYDMVGTFGGASFDEAPLLMIVLAAHIPFAVMGTVFGAGLWSLDRQREWAFVAWTAVGLNVGGNMIAMPLTQILFGSPAIGAAAVTVATEAFMVSWAWHWIRPHIDQRALARSAALTLGCCAVMSAAVLMLPGSPGLFVKVGVGAGVFVAATAAVRLVTMAELRFMLVAVSPRRSRPNPGAP